MSAAHLKNYVYMYTYIYIRIFIIIHILYTISIYISATPLRPTFSDEQTTKITYTYVYVYIYIYRSLEISFQTSRKVDKGKEQSEKVEPFTEAASLQNIEHCLNMQCSFLEKCSLPFRQLFSLHSIIQYAFQNTRFLHNMLCVINIQYCWVLLWKSAAFLKKERLLLKESAAYRRQSALKTRYSVK